MKREFYKISIPKEKVLTRDYWELLQVDPENRIEYTNLYFYRDFVITKNTKQPKIRAYLKARQQGWQLYEYVDLEMTDDTVVYRLMKVISYATEVVPGRDSSVFERSLYDFISNTDHSNRTALDIAAGIRPKIDHKEDFHTDELSVRHDNFDNIQEQNEVDQEDMKLVDVWLRVTDKRVRDRVKGKKVYDEHELLGKERCKVGACSFLQRHCTRAVYKASMCYYSYMQEHKTGPGYNPAIPDESLHTTKQPYISSIDKDAINAKMKQYHEATKPITPAIDTPKKPRCKHLLHKDECSICLGRPLVEVDTIEGLPAEVDSFMVFNY